VHVASSSGIGESTWRSTPRSSMSASRTEHDQHWCDTVRYTFPDTITWRWQAWAGTADGQGTSVPRPI